MSGRGILLERLKGMFPTTDFVARTFVAWTDGPTEAEVREALGGLVNGEGTFQRTLSDKFLAEMIEVIETQSGEKYNAQRYYEGGFSVDGREVTRPGYGNSQVGQLSRGISKEPK